MMNIQPRMVVATGLVAMWLMPATFLAPAQATCDGHDLCACLGAAAQYGVVAANNVTMASVKIKTTVSGSVTTDLFAASTDDSVCATKGSFAGAFADPDVAEAQVGLDLVLLTGAGKVAASFKGGTLAGVPSAGVSIAGDLVTGGGSLAGPATAYTVVPPGVIDTSGTNSNLAACRQAITDMTSASSTLAALPPTQTLQPIVLRGTDLSIDAVAGLNVINVDSIKLSRVVPRGSGSSSAPIPSALKINLQPTTDSVIINVKKSLVVGRDCAIDVTVGDVSKVIINLYGKKSSATIGRDAVVDPTVLVPTGAITVAVDSVEAGGVGNLFGKNVTVNGAGSTSNLTCP